MFLQVIATITAIALIGFVLAYSVKVPIVSDIARSIMDSIGRFLYEKGIFQIIVGLLAIGVAIRLLWKVV